MHVYIALDCVQNCGKYGQPTYASTATGEARFGLMLQVMPLLQRLQAADDNTVRTPKVKTPAQLPWQLQPVPVEPVNTVMQHVNMDLQLPEI